MPRFKFTLGDTSGFLDAFAAAVQRFEGYFAPGTPGYPNGSLSFRNNNPGNLRPTNASQPSSGGYRVFNTYDDGLAALKNDLQVKINRGWDLNQLESVYAPSADNNDPANYANTVARWLGINTTTPLVTYAAPVAAPSVPGLTDQLPADPGAAAALAAFAADTTAAIDSAALNSGLPVGTGVPAGADGVNVSASGIGAGVVLLALGAFWAVGKILS